MKNEIKNARQRLIREQNNNLYTKRYEKTPKGFLMRLYRNMKSRIEGVNKNKFHLYRDKNLLDKNEFYDWSLNHVEFWKLFNAYKESNYNRKLAPSVDRVNPELGYELFNMEWVTMSENSRRGNLTRNKGSLTGLPMHNKTKPV